MKERRLAALILPLLGICAAAAVGEVALTAYDYVQHRTLSRARLISQRRAVLDLPLGPVMLDPTRTFENTLVIHPFFGYLYNPKLPGINNLGFASKYDITLSRDGYAVAGARRSQLFVVGIFGGSFAQLVGSDGDHLERKLAALHPDRKVVVLNFAVGGHALPQSMFIFLYFSGLVDVAVFIDGLNEVWNPIVNNRSGVPPEYAKAAHFLYKLGVSEMSADRFARTERIFAVKRRLVLATETSLLPVIRQSRLVHTLWGRFAGSWMASIRHESTEIEKSYAGAARFFDVSEEDVLEYAASRWLHYHRLIHEVSSSLGSVDIHLLQPSPFVEGSKVLTPEEARLVDADQHLRAFVSRGYPRLQTAVGGLGMAGVLVEDLSYVFRSEGRSVWVDGMHANRRGHEIVLDGIYELIRRGNASARQAGRRR